MSDWSTKENCLQAIQYGHEDANWLNTWVITPAYNTAYDYWGVGNDHLAISYMLNALYWSIEVISDLLQEHDTNPDTYALPYYLENYAGGDITAKAICEAWAKDNFEDRALTIAFIDRQRQLIWNEPFKVQWAARPESE